MVAGHYLARYSRRPLSCGKRNGGRAPSPISMRQSRWGDLRLWPDAKFIIAAGIRFSRFLRSISASSSRVTKQ